MKRVVSWILLICITILISIMLFMCGKMHKIILNNGSKGNINLKKEVLFSVDKAPFKKLKSTKKAAVIVNGINHIVVVKYKDIDGKEQIITKKFKAKVSSLEKINLNLIIEGKDNWIKYEEK